MPTYKNCPPEVRKVAEQLISEFEINNSLKKVKIDLVFAYADIDERTNKPKGPAITNSGYPCLGLTRKIGLKDRAKGMGDVEILLDADWWEETASEEQRRALLDHELYHIAVSDKVDDLGRPKISLRKHDVQVGWFTAIAERHGVNSVERIQARKIMEEKGQLLWPEIVSHAQGTNRNFKVLEARATA